MFFIWHRGGIEAPRLARIAYAVRGHPVVGPVWRRHFARGKAKKVDGSLFHPDYKPEPWWWEAARPGSESPLLNWIIMAG